MSHDFDFADIKDAPSLLTTSLSFANIVQKVCEALTIMNEAFVLATSQTTRWPQEREVHQPKAEIFTQISAMLVEEAMTCDNDSALHVLSSQIAPLVIEATQFIADLGCMEMVPEPHLFDSSAVRWRVRHGFEWCAFVAFIDEAIPMLDAVLRAIQWRTGALLELEPEKSHSDLEKVQRFLAQDDLPDLPEYSPAFFRERFGISEQGVTASLRRWTVRYPKYQNLVFDGTRWRIEDRELAKSFIAFYQLNARKKVRAKKPRKKP